MDSSTHKEERQRALVDQLVKGGTSIATSNLINNLVEVISFRLWVLAIIFFTLSFLTKITEIIFLTQCQSEKPS